LLLSSLSLHLKKCLSLTKECSTYGQLASDLKRKFAWEEKLKMYPDARPTIAEYSPILGDQSKFHRVILDEAHWIKNKLTKSAIAACYIQSEYRWCMTGKSMMLCEIIFGPAIVVPRLA
jgi:hypothetical protein